MTIAESKTRKAFFFIFSTALFIFFSGTLHELYQKTAENETYSHIMLIPAVSAYFFYSNRRSIFSQQGYSIITGAAVAAFFLFLLEALQSLPAMDGNGILALRTFCMTGIWAGGFVAFFGVKSSRTAAFPLLFLVFLTPVPEPLLDWFIDYLQRGSAEVAWLIFSATGAPIQRDGLFFHMPGMVIEVAKQCSGIRSSLVLMISGIIAGHMFLKTMPGKLILIAALLPIAIIKNGLRIAALTLAGYYIDEGVLSGSLHTRGGFVFFLMALGLAGAVLWAIMRFEARFAKKSRRGQKAACGLKSGSNGPASS